MFGFTFADCSAALLNLWNLPEAIIEPIKDFNDAYQHDLAANSNLLYVASRLAVYNSHPGMYSKKTIVGQHILDDLGVTSEDVEAAIEHCNEKALELLSAFPIY